MRTLRSVLAKLNNLATGFQTDGGHPLSLGMASALAAQKVRKDGEPVGSVEELPQRRSDEHVRRAA